MLNQSQVSSDTGIIENCSTKAVCKGEDLIDLIVLEEVSNLVLFPCGEFGLVRHSQKAIEYVKGVLALDTVLGVCCRHLESIR